MCWFNIRLLLDCTSENYCTSKDVKYDSNNRDQLDYWAQQGIKNLKNGNNNIYNNNNFNSNLF